MKHEEVGAIPTYPRTRSEIGFELAHLKWDPTTPRESLRRLFDLTVELGESEMAWYREQAARRRQLSYGVRLLAISLLATGAVLQIMSTVAGSDQVQRALTFAQIGSGALIVAGIVLLIDQAFLITSSWKRFVAAELNVHEYLTELRYEWLAWLCGWGEGEPDTVSANKAVNNLRASALAVVKVIARETGSWATELDAATTTMRSVIDQRHQEVTSKLESPREPAPDRREPMG